MSNEMMKREMQEAVQAGERALQSLYAARDKLGSARNWGIFDMLGGGFISDFVKWVFDEVLPAIRKTGGYLETDLLERVKDNPELLLEFAERLLAENNRNRELQNRVKDMQPKADYYDHFMITGECTNIRTTAKEIEFPERKFVKLLLNRGFLYRSPSGTLLPYAVEKNNDLFIVKDYFNNGHLGSQTLVTPKGKEFFKALCAEEE